MNIQSLESSSAPLALIGNQAKSWGARSIQALSSNPLLILIAGIAIAALGVASYVFNRMKAGEHREAELNKRLAENTQTIKALQKELHKSSNILSSEQKQTTPVDVQDKLDLIEAQEQIVHLKAKIGELDKKIAESTTLTESFKTANETLSNQLATVADSQTRIVDLYKKVEQSVGQAKKSLEQKQSELTIEQKRAIDNCTLQLDSFKTQIDNQLKLKISSEDFRDSKSTQTKKTETLEQEIKKIKQEAIEFQRKINQNLDGISKAVENLDGRFNLHISDFSQKHQISQDAFNNLKKTFDEKNKEILHKVKEFTENLEIHVKALLKQTDEARKISSDNRKKEIANLKAKVDHLFANRVTKDAPQTVSAESKDSFTQHDIGENKSVSSKQDNVERKDESQSDSEIGENKTKQTRSRGTSLPELMTPKSKLSTIPEVTTPGTTPFKTVNGSLRKISDSAKKLRNTLEKENPIPLPEGFNPFV